MHPAPCPPGRPLIHRVGLLRDFWVVVLDAVSPTTDHSLSRNYLHRETRVVSDIGFYEPETESPTSVAKQNVVARQAVCAPDSGMVRRV
jgi:hypothetical protein